MKKKVLYFTVFLAIFSISAFTGYKLILGTALISPLGTTLGLSENGMKPSKIVYGYLPYWNYKMVNTDQLESLTHLALFGATVQNDGSFQRREADYVEPGWRNLNSTQSAQIIRDAQANKTKVVLTLVALNNEPIESLINDPTAVNTLISETLSFLKTNNLDGVNIDFEYVGEVDQELQKGFTAMVTEVTLALKKINPDYHISIAVYADSALKPRIWDLTALGEIVDHIIIMAYDFHRPSSPKAGPVAPLFGAPELWDYDVTDLLSHHLKINQSSKIILGVPFYGYEWQTQSQELSSPTIRKTGRTISYERAQQLIQTQANVKVNWNNQSLSPWLSYQEEESVFQAYYEDLTSLGFKYDLVKQADLAGIAIWALGYEGTDDRMWQLIEEKFE